MIRGIFRDYAAGVSPKALAKRLNAERCLWAKWQALESEHEMPELLHPRMADVYREKVGGLCLALESEESRTGARRGHPSADRSDTARARWRRAEDHAEGRPGGNAECGQRQQEVARNRRPHGPNKVGCGGGQPAGYCSCGAGRPSGRSRSIPNTSARRIGRIVTSRRVCKSAVEDCSNRRPEVGEVAAASGSFDTESKRKRPKAVTRDRLRVWWFTRSCLPGRCGRSGVNPICRNNLHNANVSVLSPRGNTRGSTQFSTRIPHGQSLRLEPSRLHRICVT